MTSGLFRFVLNFWKKLSQQVRRFTIDNFVKKSFGSCGKRVRLNRKCSFAGNENIFLGDDVYFGEYNRIMSTRAKVIMGNHVMIGPNVTIISGNHRIDVVGKYMSQISDEEKLKENDKDIIIDDDIWIGANAIILSGVHINTGAVIGAGSVVTKDVPPYAVVGGNPAKVLKNRFSEEELKRHISVIS